MGYICPFCRDTGIIKFGGVVGKNLGLTAPCGHCSKGAEEKIKMEMTAETRKANATKRKGDDMK